MLDLALQIFGGVRPNRDGVAHGVKLRGDIPPQRGRIEADFRKRFDNLGVTHRRIEVTIEEPNQRVGGGIRFRDDWLGGRHVARGRNSVV